MSGLARVVGFDGHEMLPQGAAGGEPWVRWLLQSVRARCEEGAFSPGVRVGALLPLAWGQFSDEWFVGLVAPQMIAAWRALGVRDRAALTAIDVALDEVAPPSLAQRSRAAGALLLKSTRGARYQGVLGHYRADVEAGLAPGHFAIVWAAVGHFFHLSLTHVMAEYLRLEWEMATREVPHPPEPNGALSFAALVSTALQRETSEPILMRRRNEE
jgi:hypothetical protein